MRVLFTAIAVLAVVAGLAGPAEADDRPRLVSSTGGDGAPPEPSDDVHFRYVQWPTDGARTDAIEEREESGRLSEMTTTGWGPDDLARMRPGETRRLRYVGTHGNQCDHFGCGEPMSWDIEIELVSVTRHHDDLPDDLHIGIDRWGPLHVRHGAVTAGLIDDLVERIDEVRLRGDRVIIDATTWPRTAWPRPVQVSFTLDQLRGRLAAAEAAQAVGRRRWQQALARADAAIALDPSLDGPHLARARVLLARGRLDDAAAALAPVIARNPVWLYWRLASTPRLAKLLAHPAVARLEAATPGELVAERDRWSVQTEPTGRFLAYYADQGSIDGVRAYCGIINVVDRATLAVAVRIPAAACGAFRDRAMARAEAANRRAATRTMRALGFTAASGEVAALEYTDAHARWFLNQRVEFPAAGLRLVSPFRIVDNRVEPVAPPVDRGHLVIELPYNSSITRAELVGDVVVYQWRYPIDGTSVILRPRAPSSSPPVAPPLPSWPPTPWP